MHPVLTSAMFVMRYSLLMGLFEVHVLGRYPTACTGCVAIAYSPLVWWLKAVGAGAFAREVHGFIIANTLVSLLFLLPACHRPIMRRLVRLHACSTIALCIVTICCAIGTPWERGVTAALALTTVLGAQKAPSP